jgi:protein TonB
MRDAGFYAQKSGSPTGFVLVVLLHVAVLSAIILIKGPAFIRVTHPPTETFFIPLPHEPDPIPPPPQQQRQQPRSEMTNPQPVTQTSHEGPAAQTTQDPPPPFYPPGPARVELARVDLPPPVRRDAEVDPAYRGFLQPPYPPSEQRAEREGDVRVRVTIGTNGRVIAVQMLSATSDAFWRVTERQALTRWRFRPATVDGRPVESTKLMNLHFQIQDA